MKIHAFIEFDLPIENRMNKIESLQMRGILFIISSPSGGGKGTLIREILRDVPNIGYSVSFTTREMRSGEINGKDYFFVSPAEFKEKVKADEFLEFATVHGNFYGTSVKQVENELENGCDIILEIDVQGAEIIMKKVPEAVSIFILPPSYEVLRERLIARQTESDADLALRLRNAKMEVENFAEFDYAVINDEIEKAAGDLKSIITAERLKCARQNRLIRDIILSFDSHKEF